jgi:soluble cytochrome b562
MLEVNTGSGTASGTAAGASSDLGKVSSRDLANTGPFAQALASASVGRAAIEPPRQGGSPRKPPASGSKRAEETIYKQYRKLLDALVEELDKAPDYLEDGVLTDEGTTVTGEVDELLRRVAEIRWGEGESLKLAVTVLRIPTKNARWKSSHIRFLLEAARLLRVQYLVDQSTVNSCKQLLKAHGLDVFRGSVREPDVIRRYKIVEANANE